MTPGSPPIDNCGLDVRHSTWYVDSKTFGQRLGRPERQARVRTSRKSTSRNTVNVAKYSDVEDSGLGLYMRTDDWTRIDQLQLDLGSDRAPVASADPRGGDQPGEESPPQLGQIRYPGIRRLRRHRPPGAKIDYWDMALRYKGEFSAFQARCGRGLWREQRRPVSGRQGDSTMAFNASATTAMAQIHRLEACRTRLRAGRRLDQLMHDANRPLRQLCRRHAARTT